MEITLSELLRYVLTVAFIAGFAWALSMMYRYYHTEEQPVRLLRMMERLDHGDHNEDKARTDSRKIAPH